jgi:hypothetical protein
MPHENDLTAKPAGPAEPAAGPAGPAGLARAVNLARVARAARAAGPSLAGPSPVTPREQNLRNIDRGLNMAKEGFDRLRRDEPVRPAAPGRALAGPSPEAPDRAEAPARILPLLRNTSRAVPSRVVPRGIGNNRERSR